MSCEHCKDRETCTEICENVKTILDKDSANFYKASFYEFGYNEDKLEYLLNVKHYLGKSSLLDSNNDIYNIENVEFIRYLIDNHLPTRQREIVTDYYFNGMKQHRIAAKYGVTQPTVFFHIKQGIKSLKKLVKDLI